MVTSILDAYGLYMLKSENNEMHIMNYTGQS